MANWFRGEDFRKAFKVGDIITDNGRPILIVAMGLERFLCINLARGNEREAVATMLRCGEVNRWRRWDPKIWPDQRFDYIGPTVQRLRKKYSMDRKWKK